VWQSVVGVDRRLEAVEFGGLVVVPATLRIKRFIISDLGHDNPLR
jgi:hypothetical protein